MRSRLRKEKKREIQILDIVGEEGVGELEVY